MKYYHEDKISLAIENVVEKQFLDYMNYYDYKVEQGGIIVGKLAPGKKQILITDITLPQDGDTCKAFFFRRSEKKHQNIMDYLWNESRYAKTYLGEWHTHNEAVPVPSFVDEKNWHNIIMRDRNSKWIFFIIVGTKKIGIWTIDNGRIVKMLEGD